MVDIDALQGPSEVLIIADDSARAEYCAADLLAQAEHDPQAQVVLITTSSHLAQEIQKELKNQLATLPRQQIAAESLEKRGIIDPGGYSWRGYRTSQPLCSGTPGTGFQRCRKISGQNRKRRLCFHRGKLHRTDR